MDFKYNPPLPPYAATNASIAATLLPYAGEDPTQGPPQPATGIPYQSPSLNTPYSYNQPAPNPTSPLTHQSPPPTSSSSAAPPPFPPYSLLPRPFQPPGNPCFPINNESTTGYPPNSSAQPPFPSYSPLTCQTPAPPPAFPSTVHPPPAYLHPSAYPSGQYVPTGQVLYPVGAYPTPPSGGGSYPTPPPAFAYPPTPY